MIPLLEIRHAGFAYPRASRRALNDCSLTLKRGEILALLGANGAGKSTLLSAAIGWAALSEGEILVKGDPLVRIHPASLGRTIALVPQFEQLPFNFTILDYVLMGRTPYLRPLEIPGDADREKALGALERVGLAGWEGRGIKTLSGGEHQLVTTARSLCQEPEILLLDEPTSSLDLRHRGELIDILKQLAAEGLAVLFTSHDPQFTAHLATHTALMKEGRIIAGGETREMLTEDLLSEVYGRRVEVKWIDGTPVVLY